MKRADRDGLMFILQLCCAMPFFVKVETDQSC